MPYPLWVEEEPEAEAAPIRRRAVLLTRWQSLSASIIGISASGAGGAAVFVTDNQAGSTALLLFGGLALLIGVTGRVPDRIGKEGVNYEPVDPATKAVENVLSDDSVPLELKEVVASAVRDEVDRWQLTSLRSTRSQISPSDRLSAQADAVLFEAAVRDVIQAALPPEAIFATSVRSGGREFDGIIERPGTEPASYSQKVIIEVTTARGVRGKIEAALSKRAILQPGGLVFVAKPHFSGKHQAEIWEWFKSQASSLGIVNAHLAFFDEESEGSAFGLAAIVRRAWDGLPPGQVA